MIYSNSFKILVLLAITYSNTAAPLKGNLVRFYPISQEQYDSILRLTAGRPIISEGRLINGGFHTFNNLRRSISSDINSGLRQILNVTGFFPSSAKSNKEKVDGYPLCVIKTHDIEDDEGDEDVDENAGIDTELSQGRAENDENNMDINNSRPIVSCIVVVKRKADDEEAQETNQVPQQPQQQTHVAQNSQNLRNRFMPYYYPSFVGPYGGYPAYPYYNYPYFAEGRKNIEASRSHVKSIKTKRRNSDSMSRSSIGKDISAEPTKETSEGRGYSDYPYGYGNTGNYGYGNYYQQGYPNSPYGSYGSYGGCQGYPYNYYGRDEDKDSGEESNISGEVAGEIGSHESK